LPPLAHQVSQAHGLGARAFDPVWRAGPDQDPGVLRLYALTRGDAAQGFAVFSRRPHQPLKLSLGEMPVAKVDFTRYWHLGEPYLHPALDRPASIAACAQLVVLARSALVADECLFFEGVPVGSAMHEALRAAADDGGDMRLQLGNEYEHQFIAMPDTFAEYVAGLGSRSRQSVLYSQRKLKKDMGGDVRCVCFETEADVDKFVPDAQLVSQKTYQWNLLGLGLRDTPATRSGLRHAARNGWFRSFILYCKGAPAAFMLGHQHGDCYYYDDVGYDPAYSKHSVGSVLQIEVLEYLYSREDRPAWFDFSTGYGPHKGRFGNKGRTEADFLVVPGTVKNRLVIGAYRTTSHLSKAAGNALARLGVKDAIKKMIRRRSAQETPSG
jgi:hypothetical protein